jgi:ferric-dicitrate binding protein FerR (iron transport regulator)
VFPFSVVCILDSGKKPNFNKMTYSDHTNQQIKNLLSDRQNQGLEEQIAEASRIVSEIETIDSRKAYSQIEPLIRKQKNTRRLINIVSRVAAILFIPLLIASVWLFYRQENPTGTMQYATQEITSPLGVRSHVVLPDGSNVWLNAESTIRFKVPFEPKRRKVELIGEAFFEVKKDIWSPFQVQSGKTNVTVLGTKFNYKAFVEDPSIEIVLAEGKVSLRTEGPAGGKEIIMNPGEHAVVNKTTNQTIVSAERIEKYIAWHSGKLVFDECPMPEVAMQLERWYGVEVNIDDPQILNYRITTTFENESLHQVLELLALSSPIKINYIPAKIDKNNLTQSKAKVSITSKKNKNKPM